MTGSGSEPAGTKSFGMVLPRGASARGVLVSRCTAAVASVAYVSRCWLSSSLILASAAARSNLGVGVHRRRLAAAVAVEHAGEVEAMELFGKDRLLAAKGETVVLERVRCVLLAREPQVVSEFSGRT